MISELKYNLDLKKLPVHIAVIMDGNGRWARNKGLKRISGHKEGVRAVRRITEICGEIGISVLTLYTFSSENWNRPSSEVKALMKLFIKSLNKEINKLKANNVQFRVIGCTDNLSDEILDSLKDGIDKTKNNSGLILNLAFNYGSRQEIVEAVKNIGTDILTGELKVTNIDEALINKYLYTNGLPDPDLLIRTGGDHRISNFMLWQIAYSELIITSKFWPEFQKRDLLDCIKQYQSRERRFGLLSEQLINEKN